MPGECTQRVATRSCPIDSMMMVMVAPVVGGSSILDSTFQSKDNNHDDKDDAAQGIAIQHPTDSVTVTLVMAGSYFLDELLYSSQEIMIMMIMTITTKIINTRPLDSMMVMVAMARLVQRINFIREMVINHEPRMMIMEIKGSKSCFSPSLTT